MKILFALAVFMLVILFTEGKLDKATKPVQSFRSTSSKGNLSPFLRKIRSTHGLEQELLTTSDDKQEEEVDEVGTKLMDEFMLFLSLKETGLLDMCLSSMK
ncbi:uncharacterized protein LOC128158521 [Crassostrea angulata]|uniref:uncharacterized protein n=1 Tax=Magallana gigas TaxID=29159 RepID=UPI0022B1C334|nr:uncharacterized protein LOC128158521 [Crassostrea angulata]XP_052677363.1 uncharacterized protein LOC128158521 [Crassostrea angulata]